MLKTKQNGRSMIEMLGVLAIVGILSAGAVAGYSRAMTQHKLNVHAEEINYMLATAIYNQDKLKEANSDMSIELKALGAFTWNIETPTMFDSLKNQILFEHGANSGFAFDVILQKSDSRVKVCYNYINVFKNFAQELDMIYVRSKVGTQKSRNTYVGKRCDGTKCLAAMTNSDISEICGTVCDEADRCVLYALWGYPEATVQSLLQ